MLKLWKAWITFTKQNPPQESIRLKNILQEFEKDYLKTNLENKQKEKEVNQLKKEIKTIKQIAEQKIQELENKISQLENRQEQQVENRIETTFRINTDN